MCSRYTLRAKSAAIAEEFDLPQKTLERCARVREAGSALRLKPRGLCDNVAAKSTDHPWVCGATAIVYTRSRCPTHPLWNSVERSLPLDRILTGCILPLAGTYAYHLETEGPSSRRTKPSHRHPAALWQSGE